MSLRRPSRDRKSRLHVWRLSSTHPSKYRSGLPATVPATRLSMRRSPVGSAAQLRDLGCPAVGQRLPRIDLLPPLQIGIRPLLEGVAGALRGRSRDCVWQDRTSGSCLAKLVSPLPHRRIQATGSTADLVRAAAASISSTALAGNENRRRIWIAGNAFSLMARYTVIGETRNIGPPHAHYRNAVAYRYRVGATPLSSLFRVVNAVVSMPIGDERARPSA